jgi:hypothetical protein
MRHVPTVAAGLSVAMVGIAGWHLGRLAVADPWASDHVQSALICALGSAGLNLQRWRGAVATVVFLACAYVVADRQYAGTLAPDLLLLLPVAAAALFILWPRLVMVDRI